ncbi:MAG TPA: DUF4080 domain-containing protein [Syntrophomonadaceae bacterium]|nr:DUF4080 domain-containing protein [Syntrophomonadaceae bacterium]
MAKILLCTLNSKYIHSSLALRYLKAECADRFPDTIIREFTINEPLPHITSEIFLQGPDILCFSCYIWNIQPTLQICQDIKKVLPQTIIILGGPEVSFDSTQLMENFPCIDYIIKGEGDIALVSLLDSIVTGVVSPEHIPGLVYRLNNEIREDHALAIVHDLNQIPVPYQEDFDLKDRLVYYETSRGCPYNCTYCLSSTIKGVRFFPLDRVKKDLSFFIDHEVKQVKFVDRTFNCNENRAIDIMKMILEHPGKTKFHFEICADLISPVMLDFLSEVPPHIFDFEIGIQSTCNETLEAVNRKTDWHKLSYNVRQLKQNGNIHLHLDLIAGLPFEDYKRFALSFNMVYDLEPDVLQLGFLKLLKGSSIREEADLHNYVFESIPPYQVMANRYINYYELIKLNRIEDLLDKYYNSNDFSVTLSYVCNQLYSHNAFAFYEEFSTYWDSKGLFQAAHRKDALYSLLRDFLSAKSQSDIINELLKFDYLSSYKAYDLPTGIMRYNPPDVNNLLNDLLKNNEFVSENIGPGSRSILRKNTVLEYFKLDLSTLSTVKIPVPILFVYEPGQRRALKILHNIDQYLSD